MCNSDPRYSVTMRRSPFLPRDLLVPLATTAYLFPGWDSLDDPSDNTLIISRRTQQTQYEIMKNSSRRVQEKTHVITSDYLQSD